MDLGLADKRALVLSSSRGLGRACAEALAAEGAHIVMSARNGDQLKAATDAINAGGRGRAHAVPGDLAKDAETIYRAATDILGGIDILIANTGGPPAGTTGGLVVRLSGIPPCGAMPACPPVATRRRTF